MNLPAITATRPLLLAFLAVALGACSRERPQPSTRDTGPSLDGGAIPATSAVALDGGSAIDASREPIDASAPPTPSTAPPPLTALDEEGIAHALCDSAPVKHLAKSWGCACPGYTDFGSPGSGDGMRLDIVAFHRGAFSAPDRDEAVVGVTGCESGASSSLSYGSHALVRRTGSRWYRIVYAPGALGDCTSIVSGAGLFHLICHQVSGNMGMYRHQSSLLGYLQKPGGTEERAQEIFGFETNSHAQATNGTGFQGELRINTERRFEILGAAAYSAGDDRALSIEIEVESRLECIGGPSVCADTKVGTASFPITLTFDGRAFAVAPGSRRQVDQLRAREPG
jgi:hypothetical protein